MRGWRLKALNLESSRGKDKSRNSRNLRTTWRSTISVMWMQWRPSRRYPAWAFAGVPTTSDLCTRQSRTRMQKLSFCLWNMGQIQATRTVRGRWPMTMATFRRKLGASWRIRVEKIFKAAAHPEPPHLSRSARVLDQGIFHHISRAHKALRATEAWHCQGKDLQ